MIASNLDNNHCSYTPQQELRQKKVTLILFVVRLKPLSRSTNLTFDEESSTLQRKTVDTSTCDWASKHMYMYICLLTVSINLVNLNFELNLINLLLTYEFFHLLFFIKVIWSESLATSIVHCV